MLYLYHYFLLPLWIVGAILFRWCTIICFTRHWLALSAISIISFFCNWPLPPKMAVWFLKVIYRSNICSLRHCFNAGICDTWFLFFHPIGYNGFTGLIRRGDVLNSFTFLHVFHDYAINIGLILFNFPDHVRELYRLKNPNSWCRYF